MKRIEMVLLRELRPTGVGLREQQVDVSPYWPIITIDGQDWQRVDFAIDGTWIMEPKDPRAFVHPPGTTVQPTGTLVMLTGPCGDIGPRYVCDPIPDEITEALITYTKVADRRAHDGRPEYRAFD